METIDILAPPDDPRLRAELVQGFHVRAALALAEQRRIKAANDRIEQGANEAVQGQKIASIHPDLYFALRAKFGADAFRDPAFVRSLLKKNPELRVNYTRKARVMVG